MKLIDLTGKQFGALTVLCRAPNQITPSGQNRTCWVCKCKCGKEIVVQANNLRTGHTKSCGCMFAQHNFRHGDCVNGKISRLYNIWAGMKARCYSKQNPRYKYYGARGITVCDEWKDNFPAFRDWSNEHGYADDLTIDRVNNDGIYSPDNCRWVNQKIQSNNSRMNVIIEYEGEFHTLSEWAELVGLPYKSLWYRINAGWDISDALMSPLKEGKL